VERLVEIGSGLAVAQDCAVLGSLAPKSPA